MIDPTSIITAAARRAQSTLPSKTRSEATISYRPPDLVPDTASDEDDSEDEASEQQPLTMSPVEIRVIRRLSARSNVLPVIGRADSLTDEMLAAVKDAVRTGLREAGLGFGVFDESGKGSGSRSRSAAGHHRSSSKDPSRVASPPAVQGGATTATTITKKSTIEFADERPSVDSKHDDGDLSETHQQQVNGYDDSDHDYADGAGSSDDDEEDDGDGDVPDRRSRPVIKLRPFRHRTARLSRSRSRRDLENGSPDTTDRESVANVRFSAHLIAKTDLSALLPFALIAPGDVGGLRKRPESSLATSSEILTLIDGGTAGAATESSVGHLPPPPPSTATTRNVTAYMQGPPDDLKGVFTRKFRWGTVDVLDPHHCDFAALRTAVLSTHLKVREEWERAVLIGC
jgi:hypothetical protein